MVICLEENIEARGSPGAQMKTHTPQNQAAAVVGRGSAVVHKEQSNDTPGQSHLFLVEEQCIEAY